MMRHVINLAIVVISLLLSSTVCSLAKSTYQTTTLTSTTTTTQKITPEFIRSLPSLPAKVIENLKRFENYKLATGQRSTSYNVDSEVGFGATEDEVEDAVRAGFLPKGSRLPSSMTRKQANWWLYNVTIPTYRSIVRKIVRVPLTLTQEAALVLFAQNAGMTNLVKLTNQAGRINHGNYASVVKVMPLYYTKNPAMKSRVDFHLRVFQGQSFDLKT